MRDRGEQSPAPDYVWLPQRQVQVRADSTVLVASEPEMGTMRCYHPVEEALTERTYVKKTPCSSDYSYACPQEQQAALMADIYPEPTNSGMISALIDLQHETPFTMYD